MYITACLTAIQTLLIGVHSLDVRLPPTIIKNSTGLKVARNAGHMTLECEATGNPKPQYEWTKNGKILQIPNMYGKLLRDREGTIHFEEVSLLDEGDYQCKAFNQYGTALSGISYLRMAVTAALTGTGSDTGVVESEVIDEGQPYTFRCNPAKVFPKPQISWVVATKVDEGATGQQVSSQGTALTLGRRIQVNEDGSLHFAYVLKEDAPEDRVYKCNMFNPVMDVTMGGSYSHLRVRPARGLIKEFAPVIAFTSPTPVIALEGQNVTIRCFFSGYPEPSLTWNRRGNALPSGRTKIEHFNSALTIHAVEPSDEGQYQCIGTNRKGSNSYVIDIDVQAAPEFRSIEDQPHNRNVTEGNFVMIFCKAHAEPPARVVWLRNGEVINFEKYPKYHLSQNGQLLKISSLCKDCENSDLAVIQCNASNVHGYAFADGYINILKKTLIVVRPVSVEVSRDELTARFDCVAQSDDITPVVIDWYLVSSSDGVNDERVKNISNKVFVDVYSSLNFRVDNYSEWKNHRGRYRCQAKNGYSIDDAEATLGTEDLPHVDPPQAKLGFGELWWIFVVVAIIFLLLILLICCCICLQRNKGDTYPVDEKERKSGNNPEKELADGGFHDYQRPEGEPLKESRASLNSSIKMDSDEEASLNEYGDLDAGKFTEDGSFIGDYGVDKKRANPGVQKV